MNDEITMYVDVGDDNDQILVRVDDIIAIYPSDYFPSEQNMDFIVQSPIYEMEAIIITPYGLLPSRRRAEDISSEIESVEIRYGNLN